jgi:hypothetical protein
MGTDGREQTISGRAPRGLKALGAGQFRHGECKRAQRQCVCGNAAAIDTAWRGVEIALCHVRKRLGHGFLHRMRAEDVAIGRRADVLCGGQKSCMLSRAIVVQCAGLFAAGGEIARGVLVERRMRAAGKRIRREADLRQPAFYCAHVAGLAAMGRTRERDLHIGKRKAFGRTRFDERQRLNHFHGGARKNRAFHIAPRSQHFASGIYNGCGAAMKAFDFIAAPDLDQNGIAVGTLQHDTSAAPDVLYSSILSCQQPAELGIGAPSGALLSGTTLLPRNRETVFCALLITNYGRCKSASERTVDSLPQVPSGFCSMASNLARGINRDLG